MSESTRKRSSSGQKAGALIAGKIISEALRKKSAGDSADYNLIIKELGARDIPSVQLQRWLKGLRYCISSISRGCEKLVGTTLQLQWAYQNEAMALAYTEYLTDLVAAHADYFSPCAFMLINLFIYDETYGLSENRQAFRRALTVLNRALEIVPLGIQCIRQHLISVCPYKGKSAVIQEYFTLNCLSLASDYPVLMDDIFEILIGHFIKLDVEFLREDLATELAAAERDADTQFQLEMAEEEESCMATEDQPAVPVMCNVAAHKLDLCMDHIILFVRGQCSDANGDFHLDGATRVFRSLCLSFEKVLLPTHGTSHVQFIIFQLCSAHQTFVEGFLHLLWSNTRNFNTPAVLRQAAVAYMASFVARAKYIPINTVIKSLSILSEWILTYISEHDSSAQSIPNVAKHGVFFSVCQALLYIFIFRHKGLLTMDDGFKFLQSLNFQRIVTCRLNPLKVCLKTIVEVFAAITCKHEVVFCYTIVERNRRIVMPSDDMDQKKYAAIHTGSFLPFDPYLLQRSACHFDDLYIHWKDVAADSDITADQQDEEGDSEAAMPFPASPLSGEPTLLGLSPMPMSLSPGFDRQSFS